MTTSEAVVLVWILLIFGGVSGFFTFVSVRLILAKMAEMGFFFQAGKQVQGVE